MANYGMGFKSFIDQIDDKTLSKTRRKMNKRSHKKRYYGVDSADAMSAGSASPAGIGEDAALPGVVGKEIRASSVYGQGLGFNPDSYPKEQEENAKSQNGDFDIEEKDDENQDDFDLSNEEDDFDLEREGEDEGDQDRQGVIRTIDNSHLIFKRQNEEGTYDELWIYNTGADMKDELEIRRNILAGTDISSNRTKSEDGTQNYTLSSMGNAQYLHIRGMPN